MKKLINSILWTVLIVLNLLIFSLVGCGSDTSNRTQSRHSTTDSETGALFVKLSVIPPLRNGTNDIQEKSTNDICDYGIVSIHAVLYNAINKNEVKKAAWNCDTPERSGSLSEIPSGNYNLLVTGEIGNNSKPWSTGEITDVVVAPGRTTKIHAALRYDDSDTTPPKIDKTIPADGESAAPVNTAISVTFSEAIVYDEQWPTITPENFILTNLDTNATVSATVEYYPSIQIAVLRPVAGTLSESTRYEARVFNSGNIEIEDMAGIVMTEDKIWRFTTADASAVDNDPPTIIFPTVPANGAGSVALDTVVGITFSEPMDPATIVNPEDSAITILCNTISEFTPIQGKISYNSLDFRAIFTPTTALQIDAAYTVTVSSNVADMAGNSLGSGYSWTFSTNQNPTIQNRIPDDGATNVPLNGPLRIVFSEAMDIDTINESTIFIRLNGIGDPISGSVTYDEEQRCATYIPAQPFLHGETYTITVTTDVSDLSNQPIAEQITWSFTATTGPKLLTPVMDAILPKEAINFSWEPFVADSSSQTPVTYQLIISRSSDMADLAARVLATNKSTDTVYSEAVNMLTADQSYYWSVIAFTDNVVQGSSSQIRRFKTLAKPQAVSPNNGSIVHAKPFDISWTTSENAKAYRIVISENQDLGGAFIDTTVTQDFYRIPNQSAITYDRTYYWCVYAVDTNDKYYDSYATDMRSFRMLGVPVLSSPESGSYMPNGNFSLEWKPVKDATGYHLQVRQQPYLSDNSSVVVDEIVDNTTTFQVPYFTFSSKADCYWKVSALDSNGLEGIFSGEAGIKIVDAIQVADINQTPPSSHADSSTFNGRSWNRVDYQGYLFFDAYNSKELGLYRTDGTSENTVRIGGFRSPRYLTVVDSALLFRATPPGETMPRLYQMDTPTSLPYIVENAATYTGESWWDQPMGFVRANDGNLFISQAGEESRSCIWVKNISYPYAQRIGFCDVYPDLYVSPLIHIQTINGYRLFFSAEEYPSPSDLRAIKYPYETQDAVTLTTGQGPQDPTILDELNGHLIFFANNGDGKPNLWTSDGTIAGTYIIYNNISGPTGDFMDTSTSQKMNGYLYFWAKDPDSGFDFVHLWRTNGTRQGTVPLYSGENRVSAGGQYPYNGPDIALMEDHLYFSILNSDGGEDLCRTDGEIFQTVYNICSGNDRPTFRPHNGVYDFTLNLNGRIYFQANHYDVNNNYVARLFTTDGTQTGTYAINICGAYPCPEAATTGSSIPDIPIASSGGIYFPAKIYEFENNYDRELWRYQP